ncbi:hypothetical protein [Burkholderia sp. Ac-20392]|uniref:hypothetical protein n=1 Tax=Burkholderia sp. Ac-20392 TaxID=2703905 RepID=UPI0019819239|nr:hypothetical protein [Burkholderia sp. Ac-20392]MBN3795991.1 hypothetical protein [Burkholderia sp. Ac-20392]
MTNDDLNQLMGDQIRLYGLQPLAQFVVDRDGRKMDLRGPVWKFNKATEHSQVDWSKFVNGNPVVEYSLRRWVELILTQRSAAASYSALMQVVIALTGLVSERSGAPDSLEDTWIKMKNIRDPSKLSEALRRLIGKSVQVLRDRKQLDYLYLVRQWYEWSAASLGCLGFDDEYVLELNLIDIPGRPSGVAVDLEGDDDGPLWDVELAVLRNALVTDKSRERRHVMQRAAIALCLAYGRNPANYCLLREDDFRNALHGFDVPGHWVLSVPRIKKPGCGARGAFIEERVDKQPRS